MAGTNELRCEGFVETSEFEGSKANLKRIANPRVGFHCCQWRALHWQMRHVARDVAKAGYAATATPAGT
jgi:hypothetical protein